MKITQVEPFILHVPVTGAAVADSTNRVTHWGAPGVIVHTDAGIRGYGHTGTLGLLPVDRLIRDCIGEVYWPLLAGEDPREVRTLWEKMSSYPGVRWAGRAGVTQMALAAVDVALWDIKAKAAGLPLWKLLGGSPTKRLEAYNTDGGWLNWSLSQLVDCSAAMVDSGFHGVKIKIGSPDPHDDIERIKAVRKAIGPRVKLMVDANCAWDLPTAMLFGRQLSDHDVWWLEEPLAPDDVPGHARLAQSIDTPIALGESLYSLAEFRNFLAAGAVHFVQPDTIRLGGVTPFWQVADLTLAHGLPLVPHAADMMQIHQHIAFAHPACKLMEYIPWLRECFEEPATVEGGYFLPPEAPGAGTTIKAEALERYAVS